MHPSEEFSSVNGDGQWNVFVTGKSPGYVADPGAESRKSQKRYMLDEGYYSMENLRRELAKHCPDGRVTCVRDGISHLQQRRQGDLPQ